MNARLVAVGSILLAAAAPAAAHRLDEYLQAAILAVERDQVRADLYLTPGLAVMSRVLGEIDTDGDGIISAAEQSAYAARVLDEMALTLNGARVSLRLVACEFPPVAELREGRGDIHLELAADLPRSAPERTLRWENRSQRLSVVYQVNCLAARDPAIRLGSQRRDESQSVYELDYVVVDSARHSP